MVTTTTERYQMAFFNDIPNIMCFQRVSDKLIVGTIRRDIFYQAIKCNKKEDCLVCLKRKEEVSAGN